MKNVKFLISFLFFAFAFYSCKPVNQVLLKYKYRNDFWVKTAERNPSQVLKEKAIAGDENVKKDTGAELNIPETTPLPDESPKADVKITEEETSKAELKKDKKSDDDAFQDMVALQRGSKGKRLSYVEIKKEVEKQIAKSPADKKETKGGESPIFGLLGVISAGFALFAAIWTPLIVLATEMPEFYAIYAAFLALAVGFGIASLVRKERKKGLGIAALAAAGLTFILFLFFHLFWYSALFY